jgi:tetratricopeptide (TPR) repeat protein
MMAVVNAKNPHDAAFSRVYAARLLLFMREYERAESLAAQALELSEKNQFPNEAAMARCPLGRARAELGGAAEGVALIEHGIAGMLTSGQRLGLGLQNAWLAEVQEQAGFLMTALETIQQALKFDEPVLRPAILTIRGALRLKQGQVQDAEADFRESIALARSISAKAWELRSTMSLAHLLDDHGGRDEARTMLAEVYDWFTEGFDSPDLKDAKILLDRLAA